MAETLETNRNYEEIERPYDAELYRSDQNTSNGSVEETAVKSEGAMSDVWIDKFIRSNNWKPKSVGFYIDGQTGYAEFSNVFISGEIQAATGIIGGWVVGETTLSGGDIVLDSSGTITAGETGGRRIEIAPNKLQGYQVGNIKRWEITNDTFAVYDSSEDINIEFRAGIARIGTAASPTNLTQNGAIIPGTSTGTYNIGAAGNRWATVYCVTLNESSDESLKSKVKKESQALTKILQLKPKEYELAGKKRHGFLAQELNQVFPETVSDIGKPGWAGVNYTGLIGPLVSAVQELAERVRVLEKA